MFTTILILWLLEGRNALLIKDIPVRELDSNSTHRRFGGHPDPEF